MSNNGWIKLHRKIQDNWVWQDAEMFRAWCDILLMVNHQDKKVYVNGNLVTIKRGEKLTSIVKLSERWHWSRTRVMRFLALLEDDGMCTTVRTTHGTTLKVSNYAEYQGFSMPSRTTVDTTLDTADDTTVDTAVDTQTIMNKNIKNDKEREGQAPHTPYAPQEEDVEAYCEKHGIRMNIPRFMAYYGARNWTLGKGLKVTRWEQVEQLITTWQTSNVESSGDPEYIERIPYYQEFDVSEPVQLASVSPFKGTLASEMIKRKRERKVNEG